MSGSLSNVSMVDVALVGNNGSEELGEECTAEKPIGTNFCRVSSWARGCAGAKQIIWVSSS